jgi:hypothetical protein
MDTFTTKEKADSKDSDLNSNELAEGTCLVPIGYEPNQGKTNVVGATSAGLENNNTTSGGKDFMVSRATMKYSSVSKVTKQNNYAFMSDSTSKVDRFAKLDDSNWETWSIRMKAYLAKRGIWRVIRDRKSADRAKLKSTEGGKEDPAWEIQWNDDEESVLNELILNVCDTQFPYIMDKTTGSDAWAALEQRAQKKGMSSKVTLLRKFFLTKFDNTDMRQHTRHLLQQHQRLGKLGENISDTILATTLMMSLDETFNPLIMALDQLEDDQRTFEKVAERVEEAWIKLKDGENNALFVR